MPSQKKQRFLLVFRNICSHLPFGRHYILSAFSLLVLSVVGAGLFFLSSPKNVFPKEVEIPPGISARKAARILADNNIIRSETILVTLLHIGGRAGNIQPGIYFFEHAEWLPRVAAEITNPNTHKIVVVRVPESSTLRGVAETFENQSLFPREALWRITGTPAVDYRATPDTAPDTTDFDIQFSFLASRPPHTTLEGYLFPDTYEFFDTATPREVVFKMIKNFEEKLQKHNIFEEIKNQERSLYDVLTMASLLEREAITYEDKQIIAGIINNRMRRGMPLQIDASLMYVTGRGSSLLTKKDLEMDSPYNTYTQIGLPMGPIANPGIESIQAALSPAKTPYLYYLSDKHYTIHYSKTFEEHKAKKALYIGG